MVFDDAPSQHPRRGWHRQGFLASARLRREQNGDCGGALLTELLADQGAENLFEELAETYLMRSLVSGVQPKLLVSERCKSPLTPKRELIVKTEVPSFLVWLSVNFSACPSPRK